MKKKLVSRRRAMGEEEQNDEKERTFQLELAGREGAGRGYRKIDSERAEGGGQGFEEGFQDHETPMEFQDESGSSTRSSSSRSERGTT
jgi:hypothetical protein